MEPEEREILAAFYEFGVEVSASAPNHPTTLNIANSNQQYLDTPLIRPKPLLIPLSEDAQHSQDIDATTPAYLPSKSIQAALVQIFNTMISIELIQSELNLMGLDNVDCIYLSEFVSLYKR